MRVFLCGTRSLCGCVEDIRRMLTCSQVLTVHGVDGFGVLGEQMLDIDGQTEYVSRAVLSADRLISIDSAYRLNSDACLISYDMPLIVRNCDTQPYFRFGKRGIAFGGVTENMCHRVLRSAYRSVGFDFAFAFGDNPEDSVLEYNGILGVGCSPIRVSDAGQVAKVLLAEGL